MDKFIIRDIAKENIEDLCQICILSEKIDHPLFITGIKEKRKMGKKNAPDMGFICQASL